MSELSVKKSEVIGFPRDFQKTLFSDLDKQFLLILFCCLLVESLVVFALTRQPIAEFSQKEIAQIQERFAQFILKDNKSEEVDQANDRLSEGTGVEVVEEEGDTAGESAGDGCQSRYRWRCAA